MAALAHPILPTALMLAVFVPFAIRYMGREIRMNCLYAAVCLMRAVYFIFRG